MQYIAIAIYFSQGKCAMPSWHLLNYFLCILVSWLSTNPTHPHSIVISYLLSYKRQEPHAVVAKGQESIESFTQVLDRYDEDSYDLESSDEDEELDAVGVAKSKSSGSRKRKRSRHRKLLN